MGLIKATFHGSAEDINEVIALAKDCTEVVMVGTAHKSKVWINEYSVDLRIMI